MQSQSELRVCPVSLAGIVVPVALESGHIFDLVSVLQIYKQAHGNLSGRKAIKCPLTRQACLITPSAINSNTTVTEGLEIFYNHT